MATGRSTTTAGRKAGRTVVLATIAGLLAVQALAGDGPGEELRTYDKACAVPAAVRADRIAAVDRQLDRVAQDIASSGQSLEELKRIGHEVDIGYKASNAADMAATIASLIAGGLVLKTIFTKGALVIFGHVISRGGALTMTGTRTLSVGGSLYVLFKKKSLDASKVKLVVDGKPLEADTLDGLLGQEFGRLAAAGPLIAPDLPFLTSPACEGQGCRMDQPGIADLFDTLDSWADIQEKRAKELDAWWKPDATTHLFGETIRKIEIPYARNGIRILKLELEYYQALKGALERDRAACDIGPLLATVERLGRQAGEPGAATGAAAAAACR